MLNVMKYIFGVVGLVLAIIGLVTGNLTYQPYLQLSLFAFFLVLGIIELQKDKKITGCMCIIVSLLSLFNSI